MTRILNIDELGKWLESGKETLGWVKAEGLGSVRFIPLESQDVGPFTDQMWLTTNHVIPPIAAIEKLVKGAATNSVKAMYVVTRYGIYRASMLGHALTDGRVIHDARVHSPIHIYTRLFDLLTGNAASVPVTVAMRAAKKLASFTGIGIEFHPVDYSKPTWTLVPIDHKHSSLLRTLVFIIGIGAIALFAIMLNKH